MCLNMPLPLLKRSSHIAVLTSGRPLPPVAHSCSIALTPHLADVVVCWTPRVATSTFWKKFLSCASRAFISALGWAGHAGQASASRVQQAPIASKCWQRYPMWLSPAAGSDPRNKQYRPMRPVGLSSDLAPQACGVQRPCGCALAAASVTDLAASPYIMDLLHGWSRNMSRSCRAVKVASASLHTVNRQQPQRNASAPYTTCPPMAHQLRLSDTHGKRSTCMAMSCRV